MTYYKVVRKVYHGKLVSVVVQPEYTDFYRVYQLNEVNLKVPNGMAFDNFEAARRFCLEEGGGYNLEVWTCTGRKTSLPCCVFDLSALHGNATKALQILKRVLFHGGYLKDGEYWDVHYANYDFPKGTVRLRDLKLKEKVEL
jgi:hypothetical protein